MIRCAWCGAENYAIDSWCTSCSRHLDWAPPSGTTVPTPPPPPPVMADTAAPRRRRLILLAPAAAALGVAIVLALPLASWFSAAGGARPALPNTALRPPPPAASSNAAPVQPVPTPDATSMPEAPPPTPTPDANPAPAPTAEAVPLAGDDPSASVAGFYRAVSSHDFRAAAALWTRRMQAQFPPAQFINHRFAATQQINLQAARIIGNRGGQATVDVRVVEILDGQTRHWVGTWQLVNTGSGWLLNQPNLRAAS